MSEVIFVLIDKEGILMGTCIRLKTVRARIVGISSKIATKSICSHLTKVHIKLNLAFSADSKNQFLFVKCSNGIPIKKTAV